MKSVYSKLRVIRLLNCFLLTGLPSSSCDKGNVCVSPSFFTTPTASSSEVSNIFAVKVKRSENKLLQMQTCFLLL